MTVRLAVDSLREQRVYLVICEAFKTVNEQRGESFRIVEFSVQSNHMHLLVEAEDTSSFSRGMQSLNRRLTDRINKLLNRRGSVFTDRFHDRELTSARDVKTVLEYIFGNFRKHNTLEARMGLAVDPYSSARYFRGFAEVGSAGLAQEEFPDEGTLPIMRARGKLLSGGWKCAGLISVGYCPPRREAKPR